MVVDGEVERERFSFSLNFQFRREHFYGSTFLLLMTSFQPIFGSIYKSFDEKIVYLVSIIIFEGTDSTPSMRSDRSNVWI